MSIILRKRGVFASALIKKRKYWPKYVDFDAVDAHFEDKAIGATDSLEGKMHDIPFHIYTIKEPDYTMKLMSTYGTNELQTDHPTKRVYKDSDKKDRKSTRLNSSHPPESRMPSSA